MLEGFEEWVVEIKEALDLFEKETGNKAAGLYVDQKLIMTGNLDKLSEAELELKMKQILDEHKDLIEAVDVTPEATISDKSQQA